MGKTRVSVVTGMVLAMALAVGCQSQQQRPAMLMQSDVLVEELAVVLADSLMARQDAGEELPEDYDSSEFAESVIDSMLMQHPEAFTVTLEEERRLREGEELNDEANAEMAMQVLEQLREMDASLNTVSAYLAEQLEAGELSGVRLVLANRLLNAELSTALVSEQDEAAA